MIYLIEGNEQYLINQKIDKLIEDSGIDKESICLYDEQSSYNAFIEDLITPSLFFDKKMIIYRNAPFLKDKFNEDTSLLEKYFNHAQGEVELIIYSENTTFNSKLKIYKELKKNANHFVFKQKMYQEFIAAAMDLINSYQLDIERSAKDYLIENARNHLDILDRNMEILAIFNHHIDLKVVKALADVTVENDIFEFTNALFDKNVKHSIKVLRDLLNNNSGVFYIISSIASQLRFLNTLYILYYQQHYDLNSVMEMMNVKSTYRINKSLAILRKYSNTDILKLLAKLASLEQALKSDDSIDSKTRMELFVMEVIDDANH